MSTVENTIARYYGDLQRYARSLSRGRIDADELVQDSLVRALSRPEFWGQIHNPRAYLLAILHNVFIDGLNARRRHGEAIGHEGEAIRAPAPPAQMFVLELRDLDRALNRLPADQRKAISCVGLDGMTYAEAARHMGVPLGTVMSRVSRARGALRAMTNGEGAARGSN